MKKIYISVFSIILAFCLLPVRVEAETQTYWIVPNNSSDGAIGSCYLYQTSGTGEARAVIFSNSSYTNIFVVSKEKNLQFKFYASGNVRNVTSYNRVYTVGGVKYYFYCDTTANSSSLAREGVNAGFPVVSISTHTDSDIVNYTWGASAVGPIPPGPVYSDLANVGYNTRIAGSGQAAINNLDTVSWNPETDTSGNDISDMSVSVRVVPGKYSASSRQNLYEKLYSDFVLNTLEATVIDTVSASSGSFSVTWKDVIDTLALPFATVASIVDQDGTFIKNGWIYQVRLEGDNYTGEWQTVYTATSSGVENDLTIIQSNTINQTLVNTITEINQLNNTTNNWYINETTINMSDYTEPSQGDKPWWAYLLEAIVSLINKLIEGISSIVGAIADLVGNIIDGILGLFTFDSFSVPDFSTHLQNIHDNSGIFGESIDILQTMNQTISNADSSAEPILYYPGIDLEGVEFIPEITINLNDYVEDLGLTQWHNLAYTCTDIFIWTTLIYTIYRKLIGVFKK